MSADLWGWVLRAAWSCSADVTAVRWVHSEIFCVGEVFSPCFNSAEKSFFLLTRFLMCIFGDCLLNRFKQAKLQRSIIIRTRKVILDMILMLLPQMWCIKLRTKMHLMHFLTFFPHICISTLPHIWLKLRTCDLFRVWKRFLSILWTMSWDTAALSHKPLSFNTVALESYLRVTERLRWLISIIYNIHQKRFLLSFSWTSWKKCNCLFSLHMLQTNSRS